MLKAGQVIRYGHGLWRVDFVNPSRAHILPLREQRREDTEEKGVSISADSLVSVVDNVEAAQIELEERKLAAAQRKIDLARRELAEIEAEERALAEQRQEVVAARQALQGGTGTPGAVQGTRSAGGWHVGPTTFPALTRGSQAALVVDYIQTHPGCTNTEIAIGVPGVANLPQCLSRLKLTGRIEKV